jgi:hypothetical protein
MTVVLSARSLGESLIRPGEGNHLEPPASTTTKAGRGRLDGNLYIKTVLSSAHTTSGSCLREALRGRARRA